MDVFVVTQWSFLELFSIGQYPKQVPKAEATLKLLIEFAHSLVLQVIIRGDKSHLSG